MPEVEETGAGSEAQAQHPHKPAGLGKKVLKQRN
jgi:hypothetical protein